MVPRYTQAEETHRRERGEGHFTLNDDRLYRLRRQISAVARHHDMQMSLAVVPQVDVAPSLMMNLKPCPLKHLKEPSGTYPRQLWHCAALQRAHIRQELAI